MRKVENAIVASVAAGDLKAANDHLQHLLLRDRRRAWWAVFRVAEAQTQPDLRRAHLAIVGKAYIARRTGALVGMDDGDLLGALLAWVHHGCEFEVQGLTPSEQWMLAQWLPKRLARSIRWDHYPTP